MPRSMKQTRRTMLQSTFAFVRMPHILCNPAVATPGLQLITAEDLKNFWRSDTAASSPKACFHAPPSSSTAHDIHGTLRKHRFPCPA